MLFLKDKSASIEGKYIFFDNDFLSLILSDAELFQNSLDIFLKCFITIDPFTEFEFLRDVFLPEQRLIREKFVSDDNIFHPATSHQEIFNKIQENALILSKIYSHQSQKNGGKGGWSTVDLLLAGRLMLNSRTSLLITGNKRDFPTCVFDVVNVLNYEKNDGGIGSFCIIEFNKSKFESAYKKLKDLEKKNNF